MSEETEGVAEVGIEETTDAVAVAVDEGPAEDAVDEAVAEDAEPDVAAGPQAEAQPAGADEAAAPALEPEATGPAARREAQLYLCERGHRTLILWGDPPATCNARKTRNEVCGLTLYHSTELPEQVQKALNPIKASKKKSGKK